MGHIPFTECKLGKYRNFGRFETDIKNLYDINHRIYTNQRKFLYLVSDSTKNISLRQGIMSIDGGV